MGSIKCDVCLVEGSIVSESTLLPILFQKHLGIMVLDQLVSCDNCSQLVHLWDEFSQQARVNIFVSHPNAQHQCNAQEVVESGNDQQDESQASSQTFTPQDAGDFQCTVSCADSVSAAAMWSELQAKEEEEYYADHFSLPQHSVPTPLEHINYDHSEINDEQHSNSVYGDHDEQVNGGVLEEENKDLKDQFTQSQQDVSSAPFSCTDCGKKFFYEKSLNLHIKTIHSGNISNTSNISQTDSGSKLSCPICYGCLSTEFQMNQHIRLCHPNSESDIKDRKSNPNYLIQSEFFCEYCNTDLSSKQRLEQHIKSQHGNGSSEKNMGNVKNMSGVKNIGGAKSPGKPGSKTCFQCNKTFSCRSSLLSHKMNFHTKYLKTGNHPYTCRLCNKGFDRKLSLVTHLRFHPEMRNNNNTSSSNKRSVTSSNRKNIKSTPSNSTESKKYTERDSLYLCNFCPMSNSSESAIQSHIKEWHGAGPSSRLNVEPEESFSMTSQQSEKRKHTTIPNEKNEATLPKISRKNKPIKSLSASLQDFTKTGPGKYKCNICGKAFNSSNGIDYHLHQHILGDSIKIDAQHYSKQDSNYVCNICDKTLATAAGIQYHIRHTHLKLIS